MFSSENWFGASPSFYNGVVSNSLRINDGHTLSKAFGAGPTSTTTMSFGGWLKFTSVQYANIFSQGLGGSGIVQAFLRLDGSQRLNVDSYNGSSMYFNYTTNRVLRDFSAWYHIWVQIDSTDVDAGNRVKIYVNGVRETSFATETQISTKDSSIVGWNTNDTHYIGYNSAGASFEGYIADWYFLDGQDVSPIDTVGEFKNGIFIPKEYSSATFGNKGFHLKFIGTGTSTSSGAVSNPTNIGDDSSGQNNHWAVTSSTVASHDANLPDCPENNFSTISPLTFTKANKGTVSEGNLKLDGTDHQVQTSTFAIPASGKWYWEVNNVKGHGGSDYIVQYMGVMSTTIFHKQQYYAQSTGSVGEYIRNLAGVSYIAGNDIYYKNFTATSTSNGANESGGFSEANGQGILGVAIDVDAGTIKYYWNNSLVRTDSTLTANIEYFVSTNLTNSGGNIWSLAYFNFGQDSSFAGTKTSGSASATDGKYGDFYYTPPSGHLALCSANLSDGDLPISPNSATQAVNHFGVLTYTANGNASRSIVSGADGIGGEIDFKPDWLWVKSRNATYYHGTWDSSRTNKSALYTNAPDDQDTSTAGTIGSLDTNGFTTPNVSGGGFINIGSTTYVAWNWKANGGVATLTNDASATSVGTIDSVCQANTTAGFSIVTYTGTGSNATVAHGLGATPDMVIYKILDTGTSWAVWHKDLATPTTGLLELNSDGAELNSTSYWHSTIPTDAVLSIGTYGGVNASSPFVAYCFAGIEGYSKFGSYTGTGGSGAVDGVFVYTSFRPAFLMVKLLGAGENWHLFDSTRSTSNVITSRLIADDVTAENNNDSILDFLSNGFKFREGNTGWNGTGSYIYMAFAEAPFKYALGR